jgi:hypothetical protein
MTDKRGCLLCEICHENHATDIKGGEYDNERKMWMVCKDCVRKIKDTRLDNKEEKYG